MISSPSTAICSGRRWADGSDRRAAAVRDGVGLMAIIARQLLRRYPGLRATWAVQTAQALRQRQVWRAHPRRMASWYRDTADMHTRLIVSNLELPEAPQVCEPSTVSIRLLDQDGTQVARKRVHLGRNVSA